MLRLALLIRLRFRFWIMLMLRLRLRLIFILMRRGAGKVRLTGGAGDGGVSAYRKSRVKKEEAEVKLVHTEKINAGKK